MHNGIFAPSYFSAEGAKALTDYWEQMFARDSELLMLMMANPGNYFEDSIELISVASYWTSSFLDNLPDGYAYSDILPTVAASKYVSSGFMGVTVTNYFTFTGDDGLVDRIYEDGRHRCYQRRAGHRQPAGRIVCPHLQLARPAPWHSAERREHRRGKEDLCQIGNLKQALLAESQNDLCNETDGQT